MPVKDFIKIRPGLHFLMLLYRMGKGYEILSFIAYDNYTYIYPMLFSDLWRHRRNPVIGMMKIPYIFHIY